MDFQELLNDYIELFSCTAKELADASGLTAVDISRYRPESVLLTFPVPN